MDVIWHGTASLEVTCKDGRILFDPFVPLSGSDVSAKIEDYDGFKDIFVTHGHFDHISDIPEVVRRNPDSRVYCTKTPCGVLRSRGVDDKNLVLISYGDELNVRGFTIRVIHSKHAELPKGDFPRIANMFISSARGNLPHIIRENRVCIENGETVMYMIEADGRKLCVMGSLNLLNEIEYPQNADLLVLPYNGWSDNFPPAVNVIERLKPKRVLLDHYDNTFPPVSLPPDPAPILGRYPGLVSAAQIGRRETVG